jgi:hypothetical protein
MTHSLTLHAEAWIGNGPGCASGPVIGYRVGGMPAGEEAKIQNLGGPETPAWRVLRILNGAVRNWKAASGALRMRWRCCKKSRMTDTSNASVVARL